MARLGGGGHVRLRMSPDADVISQVLFTSNTHELVELGPSKPVTT